MYEATGFMDRVVADYKVVTAAKKAPLSLVPLRALLGAARVFAYGAKKYAAGNFLNAGLADAPGERYLSAALRHLLELQHPNGVIDRASLSALDDESGLPHLDHLICGLLMLRSILVKEGVLPEDPGEGKVPPSR